MSDERERLIGQAAEIMIDADCASPVYPFPYKLSAAALVDAGWRPPPSGDVIEAAGKWLDHFLRNRGWDHGCCPFPHNLLSEMADAGHLRLPGESVSIPVPPPDDLVERVAKALYEFEQERHGMRKRGVEWGTSWMQAVHDRFRRMASAALRAAGEGQ